MDLSKLLHCVFILSVKIKRATAGSTCQRPDVEQIVWHWPAGMRLWHSSASSNTSSGWEQLPVAAQSSRCGWSRGFTATTRDASASQSVVVASLMHTHREHHRRMCWRALLRRPWARKRGKKNGRMDYGGCITKVGGSRWAEWLDKNQEAFIREWCLRRLFSLLRDLTASKSDFRRLPALSRGKVKLFGLY